MSRRRSKGSFIGGSTVITVRQSDKRMAERQAVSFACSFYKIADVEEGVDQHAEAEKVE